MNHTPNRLHDLLTELVRYAGLLHPDRPAGHAVPLTQVFALHELDTDTSLSQRDLAERLQLEKSTVSRLVADMAQGGLLVRERDPANRRYYRLQITERGRDVHARMATNFHNRYVRLMADLTEEERQALLIGLPALIRALRNEAD